MAALTPEPVGVTTPLLEPVVEHLGQIREAIAEAKPRLRGALHLCTTPLTLAVGVLVVLSAPTTAGKVGAGVFTATASLLFAVSAIYHAGTWSPRTADLLRRFDHANIFVLIAGSYTPCALLLLHGSQQRLLLLVVWTGAALGTVFAVAWVDAPRKLHVPLYLLMGWAALFFLPGFLEGARKLPDHAGVVMLVLLGVGGAFYSLGSLVYGVRRPNPWPTTFGFHEVFHSFTILAFASQYAGVALAVYAIR